jgi:hypothetical protein
MKLRHPVSIAKLVSVSVFLAFFGFLTNSMAFEAKTSNENQVTLNIKPVQLVAGKPAIFKVRLNTHSVDLGYDMVRVSMLQDSQGREYKAIRWNGSPPGGHHRSGTLEFPELKGSPKSVKLVIKGIAGVPERMFEWMIEG